MFAIAFLCGKIKVRKKSQGEKDDYINGSQKRWNANQKYQH